MRKELSIIQWMLIILLLFVPFVNIGLMISMIYGKRKKQLKNFAIAFLIDYYLLIIVYLLFIL